MSLTPCSRLKARVLGALSTVVCVLALSETTYAHPSPIDFLGVHRHDIGVALSILGVAFSIALYMIVGLRRSSRAETVREYFFYDKQISPTQYFDTTVGYSFQVAVTVYFVYWGFRYGIGVTLYAVQWLIGIYLFQLCARRLLEFAASHDTLHSYLARKYGASLAIRRLTAICTIAGLLGALIIEVNLSTDLITSLSVNPVPLASWVLVFAAFLFLTWMYIQYGGFKATTIVAGIQLPVTYITLAVVFLYLIWLSFNAGYYRHAIIIGSLMTALWLVVFAARSLTLRRAAVKDTANLVSAVSALATLIVTLFCAYEYAGVPEQAEKIADLPDSFTWAAFQTQDKIVFLGFVILNFSWQFFDMAAWQRISALDLSSLSDPEKIKRIKAAIGETKWESPVTWMFGILLGIALRHTGLFTKSEEAFTSFFDFTKQLSDNDWVGAVGMMGTYVILPCLIIAFIGIMLSTTDGLLSAVTFAWVYDLSGADPDKIVEDKVRGSAILRKSRRVSLYLIILGAGLFIVANKVVNVDILVILNTVYSAQFVITFFTLGALLLRSPARYRKVAISSVILALAADLGTAGYCYWKMSQLPESSWADWFYVLPTIVSAATGAAVFLIGGGIVFARKR
jgi:hypothetical protein